ncbi:hypothetical protein BKM31_42330 [[Actinomadura] parvosata subsp. kistnae]|uniref:Cholesterol esterase n=1 Tax=[Actinomadura] parvosata subsp. kistnae TaxID=1909395 RepID=A0A1V0ALN0_9ACTN|nr:DUF6230 family protein [Nonomuraea sp. ATCC 55076]AQZ71069.1 hypothetical protein BKM31_42330 [Nonomuraea sp. ATCC 55076]
MAEQGRVRWKRFAVILAPVAVVTSVVVGATAQGVIGATFVVAGSAFKLSVGELRGQGFAMTGGVVENRAGRSIPVIATGVRRAVVTDLCQSVLVRTPFGPVTMRLTGGRGGNVVTIDDLVLDVETGRTGADLRALELGRDAATLDEVPGLRGPAGAFGSQASAVTLRDLRLSPRAATAATFRLPDLGLDVVRGERECF